MKTYETVIEELEKNSDLNEDTVEAATGCLAFAAAIHSLFVTQGVISPEDDIDLCVLENLIDAYIGELAAATIFLAEDSFVEIPKILRGFEDAISQDDEGDVVPLTVRKGFGRFAKRIERLKQQKLEVMAYLNNEEKNS